MLDPHFHAMLEDEAKAAGPDAPGLHELPVEIVRAGYRAQRMAQNVRTSPREVETRDLQIDGASGPMRARLYTPPEFLPPGPCLVYFHGGGFVIGDLETHDAHCRRLALGSGARVLAVDYRLAPEHPFPASHDDALAATRWLFTNCQEVGVDPARVGVGGDSAGGNLAAAVAIDLREDAACKLKFQMLLYPALWPHEETESRKERDGPVLTKAAMEWFEKSLRADDHPEGVRACPARAEDLSDLPPALVVTAGYDPLEHEGRDYCHALMDAGVPADHLHYSALVHDFFIMGDVSPAVVLASKQAAEALRAAL